MDGGNEPSDFQLNNVKPGIDVYFVVLIVFHVMEFLVG
jgi:hypothetical protein